MIQVIRLDNDTVNNDYTLVVKINDIQIAIGNYDDGCTIHNTSVDDEMIFIQVEREPDDDLVHDIRIATNKEDKANE
tara:strand:- start:26 stop:256 length:231 start_codon:yes stop_codon:yes gene_type:complete